MYFQFEKKDLYTINSLQNKLIKCQLTIPLDERF